MRQKHAVIFDFDGTLADSFDLVMDVIQELGKTNQLTSSDKHLLRSLPLPTAIRRQKIPLWRMPIVLFLARKLMQKRMNEVRLFPGLAAAIKSLDKAGFRLEIMSSNRISNINEFLRHHKIDNYFKGMQSVRISTFLLKVFGLRRLAKMAELPPEQCIYVGNEAIDIEAAHAIGMKAIAVTWSGQDRGRLSAVNPEALIDTPEQLTGCIRSLK